MSDINKRKIIIGSSFTALSILSALIDKKVKNLTIIYGDYSINKKSNTKYFYSRHFSKFKKYFNGFLKANNLYISKKISIFGMIIPGGLSHIWGRRFQVPSNEILNRNNMIRNQDYIKRKLNKLLNIEEEKIVFDKQIKIGIFKPNFINPFLKIKKLVNENNINEIKKGYIDEIEYCESKKNYKLKLVSNKKHKIIEADEIYLGIDTISTIKILRNFLVEKRIPIFHHQMFHGFIIFLRKINFIDKKNMYFYQLKNKTGGTIVFPSNDFFQIINNFFVKFFFKLLSSLKINFFVYNLFYENNEQDLYIFKKNNINKIIKENIDTKNDNLILSGFLKNIKKIHKYFYFNYSIKPTTGSDFHYWCQLKKYIKKNEKHKLSNIYSGICNINSCPIYPTYTFAYKAYYNAYYKKNICSN